MAVQERLNPSFDWRESFFLDSWLHRNVHFDSNLELPLVIFLGQNAYVLKRSKSGIEFRKRFMIRSWNEGDMTIWSKAVQRVCCNGVAYGFNTFCLFGLIFWATSWAWKLLNCGNYTIASFGKFWCQILVSSWRQLVLVHNWKVVKNIPWPWDLLLNISFLMHIVTLHVMRILFYAYYYIACDEKCFQSY